MGGVQHPKKVNLFETHPLNPATKTALLSHSVAKSGRWTFWQIGGVALPIHPPFYMPDNSLGKLLWQPNWFQMKRVQITYSHKTSHFHELRQDFVNLKAYLLT